MRPRVSSFFSRRSVRDGRESEVHAVMTGRPRVFLGCCLQPAGRGGALRPFFTRVAVRLVKAVRMGGGVVGESGALRDRDDPSPPRRALGRISGGEGPSWSLTAPLGMAFDHLAERFPEPTTWRRSHYGASPVRCEGGFFWAGSAEFEPAPGVAAAREGGWSFVAAGGMRGLILRLFFCRI